MHVARFVFRSPNTLNSFFCCRDGSCLSHVQGGQRSGTAQQQPSAPGDLDVSFSITLWCMVLKRGTLDVHAGAGASPFLHVAWGSGTTLSRSCPCGRDSHTRLACVVVWEPVLRGGGWTGTCPVGRHHLRDACGLPHVLVEPRLLGLRSALLSWFPGSHGRHICVWTQGCLARGRMLGAGCWVRGARHRKSGFSVHERPVTGSWGGPGGLGFRGQKSGCDEFSQNHRTLELLLLRGGMLPQSGFWGERADI